MILTYDICGDYKIGSFVTVFMISKEFKPRCKYEITYSEYVKDKGYEVIAIRKLDDKEIEKLTEEYEERERKRKEEKLKKKENKVEEEKKKKTMYYDELIRLINDTEFIEREDDFDYSSIVLKNKNDKDFVFFTRRNLILFLNKIMKTCFNEKTCRERYEKFMKFCISLFLTNFSYTKDAEEKSELGFKLFEEYFNKKVKELLEDNKVKEVSHIKEKMTEIMSRCFDDNLKKVEEDKIREYAKFLKEDEKIEVNTSSPKFLKDYVVKYHKVKIAFETCTLEEKDGKFICTIKKEETNNIVSTSYSYSIPYTFVNTLPYTIQIGNPGYTISYNSNAIDYKKENNKIEKENDDLKKVKENMVKVDKKNEESKVEELSSSNKKEESEDDWG